MKLLLIEDEPDLLAALTRGFQKKGYLVDGCGDGGEGLALWQINEYDLVVLDLNLPTMDGLQVLREIRRQDKLQRVLILSARSAVADKVAGLDEGANDYLPKPFDFSELDARVRALLRHVVLVNDTRILLGELEVDTARKVAFVKGQPLELAPKEYALLEYLAVHRGRTVSAEELIEHIWSSEANLFTDSVKVHVSNLRRKLTATCGAGLVQTLRGQGYLIEEIREGEQEL